MSLFFCPKCKHANESEATVCAFCNEPFGEMQEEHSTTAHVETVTNLLKEVFHPDVVWKSLAPIYGIALYVNSTDPKPIAILDEESFILGRKKTGMLIEGLVDLSPFGAYEEGVSQKHAMIRKSEAGFEILDLGSTNGTWLNKKRILPNHPYPLESGSQIYLGRLCLFILFKS
jgi:hypothetical protein